MLMTLKNKYYALNKRCFEFRLDYKEKKSTLNDNNKQKDAILKICIQRLLKLNLLIINLFVVF